MEEVRDGFGDHEDVRQTLEAMVAQIEGNGIDLSEQKFIAGPKLRYDQQAERFIGQHADTANRLVTNSYHVPFTLSATI